MNDEAQKTVHIPVLFDECLDALNLAPGKIIVDGTLGGGGHSIAIARRVAPNGLTISTDRDPAALDRVDRRVEALEDGATLPLKTFFANYCDFDAALERANVERVDGFLLDLGCRATNSPTANAGSVSTRTATSICVSTRPKAFRRLR